MDTQKMVLPAAGLEARPGFGEFLVASGILDRFQLFCALQLKDRMPTMRIGACAVALGYAPEARVEQAHDAFSTDAHDAITVTRRALTPSSGVPVAVVAPRVRTARTIRRDQLGARDLDIEIEPDSTTRG